MRRTKLRQNTGEDGAMIAGKVLDKDDYNWGFGAQTGEFKDLVKSGIIDPTRVVRTALQDDASVAGLKAPPMPGGGDMGGRDF